MSSSYDYPERISIASDLYTVVCNAHADEDAWLAARNTGIGASEDACLLGLDQRMSELQLWLEKRGEVSRELEGEWLEWGHLLEPAIAKGFSRRTGRKVFLSGDLLRSTLTPFSLATLDAWQEAEDGGLDPLELKNTTWADDDWEEQVPVHYVPQVQKQMYVTGRKRASIACLIKGSRLAWADVERDESMIARIVEAEREFWRRVQGGDPPSPDGSKSAGWALQRMFKPEPVTLALDWELVDVSTEHDRISDQIKELTRRKDNLRQTVQMAMGAAEVGVLPGQHGSWTWKADKNGRRALKRSGGEE